MQIRFMLRYYLEWPYFVIIPSCFLR
jgi:hypothetical protein